MDAAMESPKGFRPRFNAVFPVEPREPGDAFSRLLPPMRAKLPDAPCLKTTRTGGGDTLCELQGQDPATGHFICSRQGRSSSGAVHAHAEGPGRDHHVGLAGHEALLHGLPLPSGERGVVRVADHAQAGQPAAHAVDWSCMSEISGLTTTTGPGVMKAGSW